MGPFKERPNPRPLNPLLMSLTSCAPQFCQSCRARMNQCIHSQMGHVRSRRQGGSLSGRHPGLCDLRSLIPTGAHSLQPDFSLAANRLLTDQLFAVVCALAISSHAEVYTDCQGVYKGVVRLQTLGWDELYWRSSSTVDLRRAVWRLLRQENRELNMHWVPSHRKLSQATGTVDLWRIVNNNLADDSANIKRHALPERAAAAKQCD